MSRQIHISYTDAAGEGIVIRIPAPYYLLGTQAASMAFWALPRLKEVGIERLSLLGVMDPVGFQGWDDMAVLKREIDLLAGQAADLDFDPETTARWIEHLTFCHDLLTATTPPDATPVFDIG
jgi:hypothetical protein